MMMMIEVRRERKKKQFKGLPIRVDIRLDFVDCFRV